MCNGVNGGVSSIFSCMARAMRRSVTTLDDCGTIRSTHNIVGELFQYMPICLCQTPTNNQQSSNPTIAGSELLI